jgi:hypothetical protein
VLDWGFGFAGAVEGFLFRGATVWSCARWGFGLCDMCICRCPLKSRLEGERESSERAENRHLGKALKKGISLLTASPPQTTLLC